MNRMRRGWPVLLPLLLPVVLLVTALVSCGTSADRAEGQASWGTCDERTDGATAPAVRHLVPDVTAEIPHDPTAFTEGLVMAGGSLWESTGLEGHSTVRRVDARTGEVLESVPLDAGLFGEGLAVSPHGGLVQLTWKDRIALRWQRTPLRRTGAFSYAGEGWGLAALGRGEFAMSDGSDTVTLRSTDDFGVLGRVTVRRSDGGRTDDLNELELSGGHLWANRWQTDEIVRIDGCGRIDGSVDVSALRERASVVADQEGTGPIDVANGIAALGTREGRGRGAGRFLLTGKLWPVMFEVRLVPAPAG